MRLRYGGLDVFYIDESHDSRVYVVTAVAVPFLRKVEGVWHIVWGSHLEGAKDWRRRVKQELHIPTNYVFHGVKLARGKGKPNRDKWNFKKWEAARAYARILQLVEFLADDSVISVAGSSAGQLYGQERLERVLHALFQRMRRQCEVKGVNAVVFFDSGHPEYRKLYRRAQIYLPTGSAWGAWGSGDATKNLPLDMFTKDGNEKNSKHCYFTQLADLIAYSAFMKRRSEVRLLEPWQVTQGLGSLYDNLPSRVLNNRASSRYGVRDGIVRL